MPRSVAPAPVCPMFAPLMLCFAAPLAATPDDPPAAAAEAPLVAPFLYGGDLGGAAEALNARLDEAPGDDDALFSLGAVKFLGGIERFAQFMAAHGSDERLAGLLPFARLPVPDNPNPQPVSYEQWRQARVDLLAAFEEADAVLARVDGPVDLPIDLLRIRIDLNGPAEGGLVPVAGLMNGGRTQMGARRARRDANGADEAQGMLTHFDRADVEWLRGYCDLLGALLETMLAHDAENWWNHCAHLIFAKPEGVPAYLTSRTDQRGFDVARISDVIAAIHHVNFPVRDPERMANARTRLLGMIGHSRAMWELILAEEDVTAAGAEEAPRREWIPGPGQRSSTGLVMTRERVDGWLDFLTEAEALLNGEKLVPFWRTYPEGAQDAPNGVNLKRVFEEPRRFDLVEWIQGPGAGPYLERGEVTDAETWDRFQRLFDGNFVRFAAWIN